MKITLLVLAAFFVFISRSFCQNPLTDSLIAYYPFDGNAIDASGNGNDGTVNGATLTTDRFGTANAAYKFDGVNDFIEYVAGPKFKPEIFPVSMTAWLKSNTPSDVGTFFKNDNEIDVYTGFIFQIQVSWGGVLEVHYGDGGTTGPQNRRSKGGTYPINDNQWHFVACVVRGPTDMDLYVDCGYDPGFYDGSGGDLAYTTENGTSGIYDVVTGTYYYKGVLDDLRFYNRELTLTDLQTIYSFPNPMNLLSVGLGQDINMCPGSEVLITPTISGNIQSYLWSNGSQTSTLTVDEPGQYWVSVYDGCSYDSDTINVIMGKPISVYLPEDTVLCENGTLLLDAGNFYDSYLWSTGAVTSSITITEPGIYSINVELNGCFATDSTNVIEVVCTGIDSENDSEFLMLYEAENHIVYLSGGENGITQSISVELINSIGQKIFEINSISLTGKALYSFSLPTNITEGVYILNAKIGNKSILRKAITYSK